MAVVYLARDRKHDRDVALKVLRPELAAALGAERFLQEIHIAARLDHPHILTLIDSGQTDGFVWYVLPYVRGESLRDKLAREKQLTLSDAVRIATHVAGALEYAHQLGIVHRDIKPENILLHEGEAVVTDFGIALAVREAGGERLTESGVSVGTPQYMSPEQATGDRTLDARSDVYSLAAVVYEMLAGEPPHTGATAHAIIAKLLTERPTRIRTIRDAVPDGVDRAVAKALAKVPADRFDSAAAFAAALAAPETQSPTRRRRLTVASGIAGVIVLATGLWLAARATESQLRRGFVVRDRAQLTFTGNATTPAISGDGTQLAYVVKRCVKARCTNGVEIQDLGSGARRTIVEGATALYSIRWSPDRRFLIFVGTMGSRFGQYIVPTLGGSPRYLGIYYGTFFPDGDSMLVISGEAKTGMRWMRVMTVDGDRHDSIPVEDVDQPSVSPMVRDWVVVQSSILPGSPEWRIVDRRGRVHDRLRLNDPLQGAQFRFMAGALWVQVVAPGAPRSILLHEAIDGRSARFVGRPDTVLALPPGSFDITADGSDVVYGDGTNQYDVWALSLTDALGGRFSAGRHLFSSTASSAGTISPDGSQVLITHSASGLGGERGVIDVMRFSTGSVASHSATGALAAEPRGAVCDQHLAAVGR